MRILGQSCSSLHGLIIRDLETANASGTVGYELGVGTAPGTSIGTPITGTEYELTLPVRFLGKRVQWSVSACAMNVSTSGLTNTPQERCTVSLTRALQWPISAPTLQSPGLTAAVDTFRPTFRWSHVHVAAADHFLVCIARPSAICPTAPQTTADAIVARVHVQQNPTPTAYTPGLDLDILRGGPAKWTVAACSAAGCAYQRTSRSIELARPHPPQLVRPLANVQFEVPKDAYGYERKEPRLAFSWGYTGSSAGVNFKLCVTAIGEPPLAVSRREQACSEGADLGRELLVPKRFWNLAESGYRFEWQVTACNRLGICSPSAALPVRFSTDSRSFYRIYSLVQDPRCTNCHGMALGNAKYQQHVAEGRFPPGTETNSPAVCATCHTPENGYPSQWRAPPRWMDFTGRPIAETCERILTSGFFGNNLPDLKEVKENLTRSELVLWGVRHMSGITEAEWHAAIDTWINSSSLCPPR